jgi:hypothetical protein
MLQPGRRPAGTIAIGNIVAREVESNLDPL